MAIRRDLASMSLDELFENDEDRVQVKIEETEETEDMVKTPSSIDIRFS